MTASPPICENLAELFLHAQIYHAANLSSEAEALCRRILDLDPGHVFALKMLVLILLDKGDDTQIESVLQEHLKIYPNNGASLQGLGQLRARQGDDEAAVTHFRSAGENLPLHAPLFNDLGVSLNRLGRMTEALEAFEHAVQVAPNYELAHSNRGMALLDCGRFDEAMHALLTALINASPDPSEARTSILQNLVKAADKSGKLHLAEPVVRAEVENNYSAGAAEQLAFLLDSSQRSHEAKSVRNHHARRAGVKWSGATKESKATVLILGGVGGNHVPTRYLIDSEIFSSISVSLLTVDQPDAPLGFVDIGVLERADVIFNALGDADVDDGQLLSVRAVCEKLNKPLLNPPEQVLRTGRDHAVELFGDIAALIVPATSRRTRAELADLSIDAPLLARPIGDHGGERLALLRNESEKHEYLARNRHEQLLFTSFYDFRSSDGYWRKYRLIFVDRQVYPYHLAIGEDWLVHYWRAGMARAEWKKREEEQFLADWRAVFGPSAANAVEEAARRLNLDYCGMDCALMNDGTVLLFEANACMLVHLNEPAAAFPYKHRYVPNIRDAFTRLVLKCV